MAVTYVRNPETGAFEKIGPGNSATDITLSVSGKAADAKIVGEVVSGKIAAPASGEVGQVLTVSAINEGGKPIAWETTNMPSIEGLATEAYVDKAIDDNRVTVDAELSADSANPVQNMVVMAAMDALEGSLDSKITEATSSVVNYTEQTLSEEQKSQARINIGAASENEIDAAFDEFSSEIDNIVSDKMDKSNPTGTGSFSMNRQPNTTIGTCSFAEGDDTEASGEYSHAEGLSTTASGRSAHAEGYVTTASGSDSHAEGFSSHATNSGAHAEGYNTTASGKYSHAEGDSTEATAANAHSEGYSTYAHGESSHAEGDHASANGAKSHAEGCYTDASGVASHVEGNRTIASSDYQHVQGQWNIEDAEGVYAHIVGNGNYIERKNAHTLDWSGNAWYSGTIKLGGTSYEDASEVALKSDIDSSLATFEFITVADIDTICNGVTEGALDASDIDELMAELNPEEAI